MTRPSVTIVVPTYRRPDMLERCVEAVAALDHRPDRLVIVVRDIDVESRGLLDEWSRPPIGFDVVTVHEPGQVAALRAGLAVVETETVAFIDDDALVHPDWLGRILDHFSAAADVGGVGGRDLVQKDVPGGWGERGTVGVVTWFGKVIGDHHRGVGPARPVQILKGANMVYRTAALAGREPGEGLGGGGAEPDNDLELALSVWAAGWTLVYDPAALVDHHVVVKETARSRELDDRAPKDSWQAAYNRGLSLFRHLPARRRWATMAYHFAVGTPLAPGVAMAVRYRRNGNRDVLPHVTATVRGFVAGARAGRREPAPATPPRGDDRLRVALVAHDVGGVGGMERALGQLLVHGSDRVRYTVVAASLDEELRHLAEWRRVPVPRAPFAAKFLVFALLAGVRARITRLPIHANGAIIPNRADVSTVHFSHAGFVEVTGSLAPATASPLRRLNHAVVRLLSFGFERWCYRSSRTGHLLAVSERVAGELERHHPSVPVTVAPNGVDVADFRPDAEARHALRAELGVPEERTVVLFVGGDWDRKGLPTLLDAFVEADPEARDLELWIVGAGDAGQLLSDASPAVAKRVRCLGVRRDVARYYQAADLFCLPSHYETYALVAFEAAAAGLPVIVSETGALGELVAAGGGILVEIRSAAIREAIERLVDDPELRTSMGDRARVAAQGRTWAHHVDVTIAVYQEQFGADPS